jgi:hypothetical protein
VAPLTPSGVTRWDPDAIHCVFQVATNRAATLQTLGDNLQKVHSKLSDWEVEAGDAFRADLGKTVKKATTTKTVAPLTPATFRPATARVKKAAINTAIPVSRCKSIRRSAARWPAIHAWSLRIVDGVRCRRTDCV